MNELVDLWEVKINVKKIYITEEKEIHGKQKFVAIVISTSTI
jgi:CRISPR/Cas system endoribonuclease Cas6 (RAMP superfamily)